MLHSHTDLRLKFLTVLMVIVLSISVTILVLRFGSSVLEDNFVAQLSTHYQNSVEFMAFYGLLNFYLYTMAFVYSPSKNAVFGESLRDKGTRWTKSITSSKSIIVHIYCRYWKYSLVDTS